MHIGQKSEHQPTNEALKMRVNENGRELRAGFKHGERTYLNGDCTRRSSCMSTTC